jgi:hypothetical protein
MVAADPTKTAVLTVLRMAGLRLSLDTNREALIGGGKKALAAWHALAAAIDQLDALVIAGLDAEALDIEAVNAEAVEQLPVVSVVEEPNLEPEVVASSAPVQPKPRPGPRSESGIPYLDAVALGWRARRDRARQHNMPFDEPPPYTWENP